MSRSLPPYLEILNPEQREAVLHTGKPLLILAGAGSGKTRVITTKIAWLIRERGMDPRSILAVTFTNKAAREMAERARLIDERAGDAMLRTFHSFGAWFLRRNGSYGGLSSQFVIYDDDDSMALVSTIMEGSPRSDVRIIANNIARAKDYFLSPLDPELDLIDHRKNFRAVYARYEEKLTQIGNVDFGDLIKKPVEILRNVPEIRERFRNRFKVVMVDEYQDANIAQSELLKELYGEETYLCVVGDDDQSIYRFRGAEVKNILEFPNIYEGAEIIRLERNYRSSEPILNTASSVVDNNTGRLGKKLKAEKGMGKNPVLAFLPDQDMEAEFCAELIGKSISDRSKASYSDWAIVYRTNAQSLGFETEFLRRKIPYKIIGSLKFYEREEVKDILALLSFLVNPRDEIAFRRMINKPGRGLGAASVKRIVDEAQNYGGDLLKASLNFNERLSSKARAGIKEFGKIIEAGKTCLEHNDKEELPVIKSEGLKAGVGLSLCVVALAELSGVKDYHLNRDELSGNQRVNNIQEVANAASLYSASMTGLLEFLEHIELDRSLEDAAKDDGDAVTLITLHNTKGLEFKRVIMTGLEQGIFPRDDKKGDDLEEERRLFYVGATRAMDELYISSCRERRMYGRSMVTEPSIFLREIDQSGIRIIGTVPFGFKESGETPVYSSEKRSAAKPAVPKISQDGFWSMGDKVYHDDQGYGYISQITDTNDESLIKVVFETGHEERFLSPDQNHLYTRIRED